MRHAAILLTGLAVLMVLGLSGLLGDGAHAGPGDITLVAVDMDPTGNDDSTVGTIEQCHEMSTVGETHTFDLVVKGIDPVDKIKGYQVDIDYDPSVVKIISVLDVDAAGSTPPDNVTIISRIDSSGAVGFLPITNQTDPMPDTDGSITPTAGDGTNDPYPPDNHESGEGVLARITVEAVGTGTSGLIVPGPSGGFDANADLMLLAGDGPLEGTPLPVTTAQIGAVSVGEPCVVPTPPPTPTPGPSPTPTPTPSPAPPLTPTPTTPTPTPTPPPLPNAIDLVAIDMDATGNDDSTVGKIENCGEIPTVGGTLTFDLVVKGIDPVDKIKGYQVDIDYDPSVVKIISVIDVDAAGSTPPDNVTIISRIDSSGAVGFLPITNQTDPMPDTDGSITPTAGDGTNDPYPPDNHESGEGVLARITIEAVGTGTSGLIVPGPSGGYDGFADLMLLAGDGPLEGTPVPVTTVQIGGVVVGGSCPGPDSDGDAFADGAEGSIGTDPSDPCANTPDPNDEADDRWPPDFDDSQSINLVDLNKLLPPPLGSWGATPGDPTYTVRRDIVPDGVINLPDLNKTLPPPLGAWGLVCTP